MERHVEANPSAGSPEAYLDGMRGVAVLAVVVLHAWGWSAKPAFTVFGHSLSFVFARLGWGVDLFFLLSGFLLARPWFTAEVTGGPRPDTRRFFARRISRLVPGYYVSLLVLLAVFIPLGTVPADSVTGWAGAWNLGAHLTFLHHVLPVSMSDFNAVNGVYWTLTVEFLFYLTLPFAVRLFTGRRAPITIVLCLAVSYLWVYLTLHSLGGLFRTYVGAVAGSTGKLVGVPASETYMRQSLSNALPTWFFVFALGIAMARLVVRHRAGVLKSVWLHERVALGAFLAGLVGLIYAGHAITVSLLLHPSSELWPFYAGHSATAVALTFMLFGVTFGPAWLRRPLESLPMRYLGWVSYGIYLYHLMIVFCLFRVTPLRHLSTETQFFVALVLTLLIGIPLATLSWLFIERPFLQRRLRRPGHERHRHASRRWVLVVAASATLAASGYVFGAHATDSLATPSEKWPLGPIGDATLVLRVTGAATPSSAAERGMIYPREQQFLDACGATTGAIEGVSTLTWGMSGSAFTCATTTGAEQQFADVPAWERAIGFAETPSPVAGVRVYFQYSAAANPADPYHFHIRFRAGAKIVGMVVSSVSQSAGERATRQAIAAAVRRYPVSR
jgi:peptidoglycan/LPS O-acetylase OafA/YrhL